MLARSRTSGACTDLERKRLCGNRKSMYLCSIRVLPRGCMGTALHALPSPACRVAGCCAVRYHPLLAVNLPSQCQARRLQRLRRMPCCFVLCKYGMFSNFGGDTASLHLAAVLVSAGPPSLEACELLQHSAAGPGMTTLPYWTYPRVKAPHPWLAEVRASLILQGCTGRCGSPCGLCMLCLARSCCCTRHPMPGACWLDRGSCSCDSCSAAVLCVARCFQQCPLHGICHLLVWLCCMFCSILCLAMLYVSCVLCIILCSCVVAGQIAPSACRVAASCACCCSCSSGVCLLLLGRNASSHGALQAVGSFPAQGGVEALAASVCCVHAVVFCCMFSSPWCCTSGLCLLLLCREFRVLVCTCRVVLWLGVPYYVVDGLILSAQSSSVRQSHRSARRAARRFCAQSLDVDMLASLRDRSTAACANLLCAHC